MFTNEDFDADFGISVDCNPNQESSCELQLSADAADVLANPGFDASPPSGINTGDSLSVQQSAQQSAHEQVVDVMAAKQQSSQLENIPDQEIPE